MGSLLEVGTGFHPELTGRENVFLNGAILGMTRLEIKRKLDQIVEFAEIDQFLETPVKHYSSGMYVRLAFAVAAHLEPEILVVDEVLAVGDGAFQKKCLGKMGEVASQGRTVILVSHNLGVISQLCSQAIWLERGSLRAQGDAREVLTRYAETLDACRGAGEVSFPEDARKQAQLIYVRLANARQETSNTFSCDESVTIETTLVVRSILPGLYGYLELTNGNGTKVLVSDSMDSPPNCFDRLPLGRHRINIMVPPRTLAAGQYRVYLSYACANADQFIVDCPEIVCAFAMNDFRSRRGNSREGFLSTLLQWRCMPHGG
jgi:lipopolysaccharide transport system ATP-binding protein